MKPSNSFFSKLSTVTTFTAGMLIFGMVNPALAFNKKGVNSFGYIQNDFVDNSNGVVEFKWRYDNKSIPVTTSVEKVMDYDTCWSNLKTSDAEFKIDLVSNSESLNRTAQINADPISGKGGTTIFSGFIPSGSTDSVMGNIWKGESSTYQATIFKNDATYAYGMSWVGWSTPGNFLNGRDQAYAYATVPMQTWMGDQRAVDSSSWDNATLNDLVLPGAHDAGMWTLAPAINSAQTIVTFLTTIIPSLPIGLGGQFEKWLENAASSDVFNFIHNVALTQKDTTSDQLRSGIRYFDFRPAKIGISGTSLGTDYYHVHAVIPGYNLQNFINDMVNFLEGSGNEHEIVMVNIKDSGIDFPFNALYSSSSDLSNATSTIKTMLNNAGYNSDNAFFETDFSTLYQQKLGDIYSSNKRLIFYFGTGYNDSYPSDAKGYNTLDPQNLINQLNTVVDTCTGSAGNYTVFQLQDTSTDWLFPGEILSGEVGNMVQLDGSPLLATKGYFDSATYPWVLSNISNCKNMAVTINDFAGNFLALNAKRMMAFKLGMAGKAPQLAAQSCSGDGLKQ